MEVRVTGEMLEALKATPEIPDNLRACLDNAEADGDGCLMILDDDERVALTELCEWYVRKDPDTGEFTKRGKLFDDIVQAIIDADLAG